MILERGSKKNQDRVALGTFLSSADKSYTTIPTLRIPPFASALRSIKYKI